MFLCTLNHHENTFFLACSCKVCILRVDGPVHRVALFLPRVSSIPHALVSMYGEERACGSTVIMGVGHPGIAMDRISLYLANVRSTCRLAHNRQLGAAQSATYVPRFIMRFSQKSRILHVDTQPSVPSTRI